MISETSISGTFNLTLTAPVITHQSELTLPIESIQRFLRGNLGRHPISEQSYKEALNHLKSTYTRKIRALARNHSNGNGPDYLMNYLFTMLPRIVRAFYLSRASFRDYLAEAVVEKLNGLNNTLKPEIQRTPLEFLILNHNLHDISGLIDTGCLTEQETKVLILRYSPDGEFRYSFENIGKRLGITKSDARKAHENSVQRLRFKISSKTADLDERKRQILDSRYSQNGDGNLTIKEIAERCRLSRSRTSEVHKDMINKLRFIMSYIIGEKYCSTITLSQGIDNQPLLTKEEVYDLLAKERRGNWEQYFGALQKLRATII